MDATIVVPSTQLTCMVAPEIFFWQVDTVFRDFIWGFKHPQVKPGILQLPNDGGGLAVPNAVLNYLASQLQHLYGWNTIGQYYTANYTFSTTSHGTTGAANSSLSFL